MAANDETTPEGVFSILDTDLYKLTMQCAVLKYYPNIEVSYRFTNRTPQMRLTQAAFRWLQVQIGKLENIKATAEELSWLKRTCPYLSDSYLKYLGDFRFSPTKHVQATLQTLESSGGIDSEATPGDFQLSISGLWLETILYEVPLLSLVSEAYFKFVDRDWDHTNQLENAREKGRKLLASGCIFNEFGSRRRRDYHTHELILRGLIAAQHEASSAASPPKGKLAGTSNVHFAMKLNLAPIGTVAHEWFMGIAALTEDYGGANELALRRWVGTYGPGVLAIALTDTFGTPAFLRAFARPAALTDSDGLQQGRSSSADGARTYAQVFTGVRQDSGDPLEHLRLVKEFYTAQGLAGERKAIVFSDSLNVERCIKYREAAEAEGLAPSFGVGTFFTNDFKRKSSGEKSPPLNIVIKLSEAQGKPAVKLSDDKAKNMGNEELVRSIKAQVGYMDKEWKDGDEAHRWDRSNA